MKLYSYFRSSAAYRVRIALNYKRLAYDLEPVNLLKQEQLSESYLDINPQGLLPILVTDDGDIISQSTAILEWLEVSKPAPALLPADETARAGIRSAVNCIACDIHPLNNLRVLNYLTDTLALGDQQKTAWYRHWIEVGFKALERQIAGDGLYAAGNDITLLDVYLVPQVYNALRFKVNVKDFPNIMQAYKNCQQLEAFYQAAPEQQSDSC